MRVRPDVSSSRCKTCGLRITWVQKPGGSGWHRPVEEVEETGFLQIEEGRLREATGLFRIHVCNPDLAERYQKVRDLEAERARKFHEAVESIDCPHPRCNGVAGGPCKSLRDGVTDLISHHPEREREAGRQGLLPPLVRQVEEP